MVIKIVSGIKQPSEPTCDELAIEIGKVLAKHFEEDHYAFLEKEMDGDFDVLLEAGYYAVRSRHLGMAVTEIGFYIDKPQAPRTNACNRVYVTGFSGTSHFQFVMSLAILLKLNDPIAPGVQFQLDMAEDGNMIVSLFYIESNPGDLIFNTHAQLRKILNLLQRMDLSEIKLEGLF